MKKLVITLGALIAATVVHASAVQWNSGNYTNGFTGPTGSKMTGSDYTMTITVWMLVDSVYTVVETSGTSATSPNFTGAYVNTTGDNFGANKTYYLTAVISSDEYELKTADYAAFTTPYDSSNVVANLMTGDGFNEAGVKWSTTVTGALNWQAVPEPTSGLMALVGFAMLALKRRRI